MIKKCDEIVMILRLQYTLSLIPPVIAERDESEERLNAVFVNEPLQQVLNDLEMRYRASATARAVVNEPSPTHTGWVEVTLNPWDEPGEPGRCPAVVWISRIEQEEKE